MRQKTERHQGAAERMIKDIAGIANDPYWHVSAGCRSAHERPLRGVELPSDAGLTAMCSAAGASWP